MSKVKRTVILGIAAALLLISVGCSIQYKYPSEGIWYCEDLEMYLNMDSWTGKYKDSNGEWAPLFILIDHGSGIFIHYCESVESEEYLDDCEMLCAQFLYYNGVFRLDDMNSDNTYYFTEVNGIESWDTVKENGVITMKIER